MSTDWIKMRVDLRTHPKVVRMASALKADKLRVIGGLFAVWSIFDAHSIDGVLEGYTFEAINDDLGWKGFGQAMSRIGWLVEDADGISAPRFDEHNGKSAKRRASETARKAAERSEGGDERTKSERIADWKQTQSGQMSACDADTKRASVEKSREEREKENPAEPGAAADEPVMTAKQLIAEGVDRKVATDWLRVRKTKRAPLTQTAWDGVKREAGVAGLTVAEAVRIATENSWQGFKASWLKPADAKLPADVFAGAR